MAQMNISNTLFNDTSTGEIAYVEQLKDRLLRTYIANNPNYSATDKGRIPAALKAEVGVFQEKLNEFFLDHWVDFQRFLLDEGMDPTVIDSWKEVQEFLEGLPDDETMWLKNKLTALDTAIAGIDQDGIGTFDVSAYNNTGGVYAQYADLAAALAGVPVASRRSGMTIRFIDSDTQQYEQWEYKKEYANTTAGNAAFTTVGNWYGFQDTDEEPTAGSVKPVQSGGAQKADMYNSWQVSGLADILYQSVDTEEVTFLETERHISISSSGIVSTSTEGGAIVRYIEVSKGDIFLINSQDSGYISAAIRYGVFSSVPQLGDIAAGFINVLANTPVNSLYVCGENGYFGWYSLRTNVKITKVSDIKTISKRLLNKIPFSYVEGGVSWATGVHFANVNRYVTDYIDISNMKSIIYTRSVSDGVGGGGMAFYNSDKEYISGEKEITNQTYTGYKLGKLEIPEGAVYARFSFWRQEYMGIFFIADGERDSVAKVLYDAQEGFGFSYSYNEENEFYDGNISKGGQDVKIETHHNLNRIYTHFDGDGANYVTGNRIYGLIPEKMYRMHLYEVDLPQPSISADASRFLVGANLSDNTFVEIYRVNRFVLPDQDIVLQLPANTESLQIGGRCNVGYTMKCYIEELDNNSSAMGYTKGVYRKTSAVDSSDLGYSYDNSYGISKRIPVSKGDTVVWSYGNVATRTFNMGIFDTAGTYLDFFNNTVANIREITNFMSTSELESFYIEVSFLIANSKDSYVEVNGKRVWYACEDVSTLASDVSTLASNNVFPLISKVNDISNDIYYNITFERKSTDSGNGNQSASTTRLSSNLILGKGRLRFEVADGYLIRSINYYDKNGTWYAGTIYKTRAAVSEEQNEWGYLRIVVNKDDDTAEITLDDPIGLKVNDSSGIEEDKLQVGTFNSSYNGEDTEAFRLKYCGLLKGTEDVETFLFFTDPHLTMRNRAINTNYGNQNPTTEKYRDSYISMMQKYYNSVPLDSCICGGDWINSCDTYEQACEALGYQDSYMRKLFKRFYPTQGNHDDNPYKWGVSDYHKLTQREVNNLMFRENGGEYYSFDGINTKFYVMNTGDSFTYTMNTYRWTQVAWFANKLLTDNPAHAIIVTHIFSNGLPSGASGSYPNWMNGVHQMVQNLIDIANAFNNKTSITKNSVTYDFTSSTGKVECYITGHLHADVVDTFHEIPAVVITDIQGGAYADRINYANHSYTKVPTFDCCLADYTNRRLHLVRVGAGVSRTVNLDKISMAVNDTTTLTSVIGTIETWHAEHPIGSYSGVLSVDENGVVTALSTGIAGVRAINEDGDEEYWTIKVS